MEKERFFFTAALSLPVFFGGFTATSSYALDEVLALEEIIVTANRREQSLQEVPMSISAFTGEFFKDTGVTNLASLEQYTPNLKFVPGIDSSSTSIRIRGIGSVGTNSGIDPSVGMFIDGVYQGRAGMSVSDLIDIERIEVLRGPQGSLYGKNTSAGAISILTNKPVPEFEALTELSYNNDERIEVRGMVNVPFGSSGHATRITGFGNYADHLYTNTYNGEGLNDTNKWGGKARTLFTFDTAGDFLLTLDYSKEDTDCCALAVLDYDGLSTLNSPLTNTPSAAQQAEYGVIPGTSVYRMQYLAFEDTEGFPPPAADPFGKDYWLDGAMANKVSVGGTALEWNKDLAGDHIVTFINAWRHYESDTAYDGDFTAYNAVLGSNQTDLNQYSSELRIASPSGEQFEYLGGLYTYYSEMDSVGTFSMGLPLVENIGLAVLYPDGTLNTDDNTYKTTSYAAFGQLSWNINEEWSATLGTRYTYEKKERDGSQITIGFNEDLPFEPIDVPPVAGPDIYFNEDRDDDDISPSLSVRYFVTPDVMTYASISRGFKSGGFDQRRVPVGENGEFEYETSTNYELGWKGIWMDRRLQLNGTFFYIDYEDFQAQAFNGSSIQVTNAGSMESYGMEMDAQFAATTNLIWGAALGYTHATYQEFDNGQCTVQQTFDNHYLTNQAMGGSPGTGAPPCLQDLAGEQVDNSPEWSASSYLQYERGLTEKLIGIARLEYNYTDSFFLDQDLDANLKNDAVSIVNLRLTVRDTNDVWEVALWGRNLLDEEYYVFGIDLPTVGGYGGVTAPDLSYGVSLRYAYR